MNKDKEFDIEKRTYQFSLDLLKFAHKLPRIIENSVLIKQILRSGTSIGSNIYEVRDGHSIRDFANYYSIALKSANETIYWLRLIKDANKDFTNQIDALINEAEQLSKIIAKCQLNVGAIISNFVFFILGFVL